MIMQFVRPQLRLLTSEEIDLVIGGVEHIYVDGKRITWGGISSFYSLEPKSGEEPDPTVSSDPNGGGIEHPDDFNPPKVAAECLDLANKDQVTKAAEKMINEVNRLTPLIDNLADDAKIKLADGKIMTGAELRTLWRTIDFVVTDQRFGEGRSGAYDPNTRTTKFNATDALGYAAHRNGLSFILLHEVVHSSPQGQLVNDAQWQAYLADGGVADPAEYAKSAEFAENEEYCNVGALRIAIDLGVNPIFDGSTFAPTHGYEYGDLGK